MTLDELKAKYLTGKFKLKTEFLTGQADRQNVISRAEQYASWTIPSIFPREELTDSDELQSDYQSIGASATVNLANKIMMALFQPSRPFFRMNLLDEQMNELLGAGQQKAQIEAQLAEAERAAMKRLNSTNARIIMHDMVKQLIVTGNSLLGIPNNSLDKLVVYSIRDYSIERDLHGDLVKLIIRETKAVSGLSDELAQIAKANTYNETDEVSIYTGVKRVGDDKYIVWQEMESLTYCHESIGVYKKDNLPWIPLAWDLARGKNYGSGLVELHAGDFHKLSNLAQAINDYSLVITDVKILVNPAGSTDVREITKAKSGAYVHGIETDLFVHAPQVSNITDFLNHQFDMTTRRLGAAFLLNTAVTRDAERVTAQEIRMQAQELESSLGGVYSRLANELQLPLAKRLLQEIDEVFKDIEPVIVTGLESLSRNSELDNFRAFMQDLVALTDVPEEAKLWMRFEDIIAVLGAGHGVDYKKFLKDKKQVDQERQEMMQANAQAAGMEAQSVAQAEQTGP